MFCQEGSGACQHPNEGSNIMKANFRGSIYINLKTGLSGQN